MEYSFIVNPYFLLEVFGSSDRLCLWKVISKLLIFNHVHVPRSSLLFYSSHSKVIMGDVISLSTPKCRRVLLRHYIVYSKIDLRE